MTTHEPPPRPFTLLAITTSALGIMLLVLALAARPPHASAQLGLVLIAVLVSETYLLRLPSYSVSLSMPLVLTALMISGPGAAAVAGALSSVSLEDYRQRRPFADYAFNLGQLTLSSAVAGWAYVLAGGAILSDGKMTPLTATSTPRALIALVAAAVVFNALNILLVSGAVRLGRGVPFLTVFRDLIAPLPTQMALAMVGLLMAQVLIISPLAFPLFLFPLFLARQVYQRYAGLRDAYLDMVRSLVGALEAKDPYTRGHSERVAQYARALAGSAGDDDRTLDNVEQAALLHDIGKLSLPCAVLSKPAALSAEEVQLVRRHPWVGGEMVKRIPALRRLVDPIQAHHERIDGSGYPIGMRGSEIPYVARLLAVVDAYDAMTTHRAYRPAMSHSEAVRELERCSGLQFDEVLVTAFVASGIGIDPIDCPEERSNQTADNALGAAS